MQGHPCPIEHVDGDEQRVEQPERDRNARVALPVQGGTPRPSHQDLPVAVAPVHLSPFCGPRLFGRARVRDGSVRFQTRLTSGAYCFRPLQRSFVLTMTKVGVAVHVNASTSRTKSGQIRTRDPSAPGLSRNSDAGQEHIERYQSFLHSEAKDLITTAKDLVEPGKTGLASRAAVITAPRPQVAGEGATTSRRMPVPRRVPILIAGRTRTLISPDARGTTGLADRTRGQSCEWHASHARRNGVWRKSPGSHQQEDLCPVDTA